MQCKPQQQLIDRKTNFPHSALNDLVYTKQRAPSRALSISTRLPNVQSRSEKALSRNKKQIRARRPFLYIYASRLAAAACISPAGVEFPDQTDEIIITHIQLSISLEQRWKYHIENFHSRRSLCLHQREWVHIRAQVCSPFAHRGRQMKPKRVLCDEIGSARDGLLLLVGVTLLSSLLVNFCSLRFPFFHFSYVLYCVHLLLIEYPVSLSRVRVAL